MTDSATARTTAPVTPTRGPAPRPELVRTAGPLPALRLLPAPPCEPPYDDELETPPALRLVPPLRPRPAPRSATPRLVPALLPLAPLPVPPPATSPARPPAPYAVAQALPADDRPVRTPTCELPAARPFAVALVQRLLEVCGGVRPVPQLQRDTSPNLYLERARALVRRPRATGARPGSRDVRSVHVQERPDGVAEVCATVRRGDRLGAVALRLEGVHGRWLCTQLQGV